MLRETEIEIAKRFSENGIGVPFQGEHIQSISLHRRVQGHSGANAGTQSDHSEFEFIATPQSSTAGKEIVEAFGEHLVEVVPTIQEDIREEEAHWELCKEALPVAEQCKPFEETQDFVYKEYSRADVLDAESILEKPIPHEGFAEPLVEVELAAYGEPITYEKLPSAEETCKVEPILERTCVEEEVLLEPELEAAPPKPKKNKKFAKKLAKKLAREKGVKVSSPVPEEVMVAEELALEPIVGALSQEAVLIEESIPGSIVEGPGPEFVGGVVFAAPAPPEEQLVEEFEAPPTIDEPSAKKTQEKLPQEIEEQSITATWLHRIPEGTISSVKVPAGYTIVLKIIYTSGTTKRALGTMVILKENTHQGILLAVNSYLDSKTALAQKLSPRRIKIKYGAGKNGDLELSGVDENMWPDYLEYFRQCTRFPELTVDVVEN